MWHLEYQMPVAKVYHLFHPFATFDKGEKISGVGYF
ncbi:hypothetical protein SAMN05518872_12011 [Psychrobacillus sp. OK032]|nr:hypothetical protein SAMN05518872_12011 [Psychrobacillus sp. OK032]